MKKEYVRTQPHAPHAGKHQDKYQFNPPTAMKDAKERLRDVTTNILNVEKQLGDEGRKARMGPSEYQEWREKTKAAKIYMISEQQSLKDWIFERRRALQAEMYDIWSHKDPRALLQQAIVEGRLALAGKENDLSQVLELAELCLNHDA
jgi:hypothetical protein